MKLSEIKEKLERNEWILPPFQREFVWNEEQKIIEFIESVFHEWPIGSIILWVPDPKDEAIIKKRKLQISSVGKPQYLQEYVIDGQQRITTLLKILTNEPFIFKGKENQMFYDFSSKKFVFMEANGFHENVHSKWETECRTIKASYKRKTSRMLKGDNEYEYTKWYKIKPDGSLECVGDNEPDWNEILPPEPTPKHMPAVEYEGQLLMEQKDYDNNRVLLGDIINLKHSEIKNRLKLENLNYDVDDLIGEIKKIGDYDITIQKPKKSISLKDAQELFIRLNTGGKQLPSVDLALAYISLLWDDSRDEFKNFKESLKVTGFYFDLDFFIRCLSAVSLVSCQ